MTTAEVVTLARKYVGNGAAMESSARLCLADAITASDAGDLETAKAAAIRSLRYSVGILSPDYQRAAALPYHTCPNCKRPNVLSKS